MVQSASIVALLRGIEFLSVSTVRRQPAAAKSFQQTARLRSGYGHQGQRWASSSAQRRQQVAESISAYDMDVFVPFDLSSVPEGVQPIEKLRKETSNQPERAADIFAEQEPDIRIREDLQMGDVPTSSEGLAGAVQRARLDATTSAPHSRGAPRAPKEQEQGLRQREAQTVSTIGASRPSMKPLKPLLKRRLEPWQTQKSALNAKFPTGYNPAKKLSPDTQDGIRALHTHDPSNFTTAALARQFEVSPEAIRRILKSKWRPSADEEEKRRERWERRGERIWNGLVDQGMHAPKAWRTRGIGTGPRRRAQVKKSARQEVPYDSGKWLGDFGGRVG